MALLDIMSITQAQEAAFWRKVEKTPDHWYWKGALSNGYGSFTVGRETMRASRVAYELEHGELDGGWLIAHHCDTRECVRPDHLFATDAQGNMANAASKNRMGMGRGIKFSRAKIQDVKLRYATGRYTRRRLAAMFDMSWGYLDMILSDRVRRDAKRPEIDQRRCTCSHLASNHILSGPLAQCAVVRCRCERFEQVIP